MTCGYECSNVLTGLFFSIHTAPPPPVIYITATGTSLAGQPYTLTCLAVLLEGSSDTADVQWLGPAGAVIVNDGGIMISDLMINSGVMFSKILTFATLLGSQAGEYTCQAGFPDPDGSSSDIVSNQTTIVTVQSTLLRDSGSLFM